MGRSTAALAATLFTSALIGQQTAEEGPPPPREWFGHRPWLEWDHALGDLGGLRTSLDDLGIAFGGGGVLDWSAPWRGGLRNRDTARGILDLNLTFDGEKLFGARGLTLFLDAYAIEGRVGAEDSGDLHAFSNVDGPNRRQLAEAWAEQKLLDDKLRIKFGKVDANSEFAFIEAAGELTNSAAGFTPTIQGLPTYPDPATSLNVFAYPGRFYAGAGLYDGASADGVPTGSRGPKTFFHDDVSNSWFAIGEAGVTWGGGGDVGHGRFGVGCWHHTATFARFDGGTESGLTGAYAFVEHRVWRENPGVEGDDQGIDIFLCASRCDGAVAEVEGHVLLGACWHGPLPRRDADALSFMISHLDLSDDAAAGFASDETAFELNYKLQLTPFLVVRPCLHYITRPGGDPSVDDAFVGMLRIETNF